MVITGTTVSFTIKLTLAITMANIKMGFEILFIPIPHARITVISELRLKLFNVITVASKTPIGIVITKTDGK